MSPRLFHFRVVQTVIRLHVQAPTVTAAVVVVVVLLFTATKFGTATCLKAKTGTRWMFSQARSLTCRVAEAVMRDQAAQALFFSTVVNGGKSS